MQALEGECEAVQRLSGSVDATNQTLVDSMCDMSGERLAGLVSPPAWGLQNDCCVRGAAT
jgi:predicted aconitase with swiveling domain